MLFISHEHVIGVRRLLVFSHTLCYYDSVSTVVKYYLHTYCRANMVIPVFIETHPLLSTFYSFVVVNSTSWHS